MNVIPQVLSSKNRHDKKRVKASKTWNHRYAGEVIYERRVVVTSGFEIGA